MKVGAIVAGRPGRTFMEKIDVAFFDAVMRDAKGLGSFMDAPLDQWPSLSDRPKVDSIPYGPRRLVCRRLLGPTDVSASTLVRQCHRLPQSFDILGLLIARGLGPDAHACVSLMHTCNERWRGPRSDLAARVWAFMEREGIERTRKAVESLAVAASQSVDVGVARVVRDAIVGGSYDRPGPLELSHAVVALARSGPLKEARDLLAWVDDRRLMVVESVVGIALLERCTIERELEFGRVVHDRVLQKKGLPMPEGVPGALIGMYAACGDIGALMEALGQCEGFGGEAELWNRAVAAMATEGKVTDAMRLFKEMIASRKAPEGGTVLALLRGLAEKGSVAEAERLLSEVTPVYGLEARAEDHAAFVGCLLKAGKVDEAEVYSFKVETLLDVGTLETLLASANAVGRVDVAQRTMARIKAMEITLASTPRERASL
ncbi:hypothetical protein HK101_005277 [Irineochytrium annulatum]|nr:hypothetical protein HK101_005277 [Irineochytrium annulatum]